VIEIKKCRYGAMLFNPRDIFIGGSLRFYGEFSEGEVEMFRAYVRAGDVVVDVGANIGCHTVPLAQMVGESGRVYAFEPQRWPFMLLCANAMNNGLLNVHPYQCGVGAECGTIDVPEMPLDVPVNSGAVNLRAEHESETHRVPLVTLDSLDLRPRFIKIDVEGMEPDVLRGAESTIRKCRPILYVENDRDETRDALFAVLREYGYRAWRHEPLLFNPDNHDKNADNVFGAIASENLLCVHRDDRATPVPRCEGEL
jgi:FkbM family methyltransferase